MASNTSTEITCNCCEWNGLVKFNKPQLAEVFVLRIRQLNIFK